MGQFFNRFIPSPIIGRNVIATLSSQLGNLHYSYTEGDFEYYLASEKVAGAAVEIKLLNEEAASDPERREMFCLESQAASSLSHINILESGAAQESNGLVFCVQDYKQKALTLTEMLRREGWLGLAQAIDITDEIASALDYAHQQQALHLNLNPGNILVESNGLIYIKGFGVEQSADCEWARRYRSRRQPAPYLSIEQIAGEDADFRSDLYSLGLLAFEMLTDRVPFDPEDALYTANERARHTIPPPHFFRHDIPASVSDVVLKMLARKPAHRFDSASGFVSALRDAAQTVCQESNNLARSIAYVP